MYHYTSIDGFNGILDKKTIRMTRSEYLNDPADCKLFTELISKYLTSEAEKIDLIISSNLKSKKAKVLLEKAPVIDYIKYLQGKIGFYVLSLTESQDEMSMWNYYGNGGVEIEVDIDVFAKSILSVMKTEKEYLAASKVIYTNSDVNLSEFNVPQFNSFSLYKKNNFDVFKESEKSLTNKELYNTNKLDKFIDDFIKDYAYSINYLFQKSYLNEDSSPVEIFEEVYTNTISTYSGMIWKRDILLYVMVISALIKSNTYEYENEFRLVYFDTNLSEKSIVEEYLIKESGGIRYFHPYIKFEGLDISNSVKGITLSPLTQNLPIAIDLYKSTVEQFIKSVGLAVNTVKTSKHKIRW